MEDKLARYLEAKLPAQKVSVTNLYRIPGGASRETWMFDAAWEGASGAESRAFVVRKDPPASLLETDRETEYAFYSAFWGSRVPVPRMRWLEPDASILGGPFFIMDRILGCEANTRVILAPPYLQVQQQIARNMYEILGAIATFDWRGTPIERAAESPTTESAWQKELAHWEGIIDAQELSPQPVMRAAIRWLRANPPPPAQRISVVHGDYRVGNFLYRDDGSIHGIVDWEMAHLGDPIEDLAWSFNQSWRNRRPRNSDRDLGASQRPEGRPRGTLLVGSIHEREVPGHLGHGRSFVPGGSNERAYSPHGRLLTHQHPGSLPPPDDGEDAMRPNPDRTLQGVAMTLLTDVMREVQTPFGQSIIGMAAMLTMM
ncbi:MAG TPA: phosphotransferase, partial [Tepidiformaceae bacterium]|nr:phosphotransferase [Tepidiformaceae bacterium]